MLKILLYLTFAGLSVQMFLAAPKKHYMQAKSRITKTSVPKKRVQMRKTMIKKKSEPSPTPKAERRETDLEEQNREDHDYSLYLHPDGDEMQNNFMSVTQRLGEPHIERKLTNEKQNKPKVINNPKLNTEDRKLILTTGFNADEKRYEQRERFKEIYRQELEKDVQRYQYLQHVHMWANDAVDEIHRLYLKGLGKVKDSREFLMDKMDVIYNNFITPARWNV